MVLDLDLFREDKGNNPQKIRDDQTKRFKDVALVDIVVEKDTLWRQLRHQADSLNKLKNVCSKEIGEKMKKKESLGDDQPPPQEILEDLDKISSDNLKSLTVNQIKKLRDRIDEEIGKNNASLVQAESERNAALREVGNHLHESVPVSNDEDENKVNYFIRRRSLMKFSINY